MGGNTTVDVLQSPPPWPSPTSCRRRASGTMGEGTHAVQPIHMFKTLQPALSDVRSMARWPHAHRHARGRPDEAPSRTYHGARARPPAQTRGVGMSTRAIVAAACLALLWCGLSAPAASQGASSKSARAIQLDAGPSTGSAPDPLAPPDVTGPAPAAPGAPAAAPDATVAENADPIVVQVRERLSATAQRSKGGEREDYDGLVAYYARAGQPIWTDKDGLTAPRRRRDRRDPQGRRLGPEGIGLRAAGRCRLADDRDAGRGRDQARGRRAQVRATCARRARGPLVDQPHDGPEAGHLRPSVRARGRGSLERRRCLSARFAPEASAVRAPAPGDAAGARWAARGGGAGRPAHSRRPRDQARSGSRPGRAACASGWRCRPATPRRRPTTPRWSMRSRPTRASTPSPPAAPSTTPPAQP